MVHFKVDFEYFNSFADITLSLAKTLFQFGVPVSIEPSKLSRDAIKVIDSEEKEMLEYWMKQSPSELFQLKWSHYWQTTRDIKLQGHVNLELFAINYEFARNDQPDDDWIASTRNNSYHKLAVSHYCKQILLQAGCSESEVSVLPLAANPILLKSSPLEVQVNSKKSPEIKRFLHLTNSWDLYRFGTDVFLPLFCEEFQGNPRVMLIIKDGGSNNPTLAKMIESLSAKYGRKMPSIYILRRLLNKSDLAKLYLLSDVLVAPFRGEGFAIKILDAFAAGLPVIMPLYGGPTEYANPSNCYPIEYDLVPLGNCYDTQYFKPQNSPHWAEPNRESLRQQLHRVLEDENQALVRQNAKKTAQQFSWENSAKKLLALMRKLC
ncbi:glycosyltransferase family 4 protein [Capilliphycus salinus ALCB114379]|uniref:glycosyltransferase family 4 protein n=1 Tax=Capilliphycus salinus TaxID=2768948 RepID=UPI0039A64144